MAQYNITLSDEILHGFLSQDQRLAKLLEQVLNQILEAQLMDQLGAGRYSAQRSEKAIERVLSPPIDDSGGTVDLARAADKGWGIFHRTLSMRSTERTSSGTGPHGNGRKRSVYPQDHPNHRRIVRDFVFQVHGLLVVQRTGSDDPKLESTFPS